MTNKKNIHSVLYNCKKERKEMNVQPISFKTNKKNVNFNAGMKTSEEVNTYTSKMIVPREAFKILKKSLEKRPEQDVLLINKLPPEKAKSIHYFYDEDVFVKSHYDPEKNRPWLEFSTQHKSAFALEDLELQVGDNKTSFFMNIWEGPEKLAKWLEETYDHLRK